MSKCFIESVTYGTEIAPEPRLRSLARKHIPIQQRDLLKRDTVPDQKQRDRRDLLN